MTSILQAVMEAIEGNPAVPLEALAKDTPVFHRHQDGRVEHISGRPLVTAVSTQLLLGDIPIALGHNSNELGWDGRVITMPGGLRYRPLGFLATGGTVVADIVVVRLDETDRLRERVLAATARPSSDPVSGSHIDLHDLEIASHTFGWDGIALTLPTGERAWPVAIGNLNWWQEPATVLVRRAIARKASDIPDRAFLAAVETAIRRRNETAHHSRSIFDPGSLPWTTATVWDVATVLAGHLELVGTDRSTSGGWDTAPWKVLLAKARTLIERRKLLEGCACGCRGDWRLTEKGRLLLRGGEYLGQALAETNMADHG